MPFCAKLRLAHRGSLHKMSVQQTVRVVYNSVQQYDKGFTASGVARFTTARGSTHRLTTHFFSSSFSRHDSDLRKKGLAVIRRKRVGL